jgi:NTP pyrophosphatase (non-canonical NTP hydrolase)
MAMAAESGEVLAELQWLTDEQVDAELSHTPSQLRERLGDELADVMIYLLLLADAAGVDIMEAAAAKNVRNEDRFPPT